MVVDTHKEIKKAIHRSQHCQRNWDLTKQIPEDDLNTLIEAVTQCPSKQNKAFYKVHFITRRDIIENVHRNTKGFGDYKSNNGDKILSQTNSQVLANLLIVFESYIPEPAAVPHEVQYDNNEVTLRDQQMAVGIAAGYANVIATMLGYSTGCCACYDPMAMASVLNLDEPPLLLMGIGFKDENRNRREHHKNNFMFPTIKKHEIPVNIIK